MTTECSIEARHSREGGNPVASIRQLLHYNLGFLDNQIIMFELFWGFLYL
jgi:hypothetical protein